MIWIFPNGTKRDWVHKTQEDQVRIECIQHNGTYTCTALTKDGKVINANYELQAVACPPGKMGELCEDACDCEHGASCDRWSGCVCPSGWTGAVCQTPCPVGTYGQGCRSECHCQNDAVCDPIYGRCNCTEGWYGMNCIKPCPNGLYGRRCRHVCDCKNNATCHHVDGSCKCMAPWTGQWCDVVLSDTSSLPLQILIPLSILTLLVSVVLLALYKRKRTTRVRQDENIEETQALLELRSIEGDLAQSLQPGWLNRWERNVEDLTLDELIGLGTFAHVRKGHLHTADVDTTVAVKSVRGEDRLCYRAFCREVAILIAVHEQGRDAPSNITKLLGVITKSRPKCILLEYAAKRDLLGLLKQHTGCNGALPLGSLVRYAVHVSCALKELRRLRIAHGDVAARNVLVNEDDVAKLADFGSAHDVYTTTYVSSAKMDVDELLPLKWMALESLESREFTCESDMWSFGVLLWEIATYGEEPNYEHKIQLSCPKLVGILRRGIRLQKPPECPRKLYGVMLSCWREEPSARPTPEELEQRLTECRHEIDPLFVVERETML
ncbi:tyrosine-protein kinase receptor torso-like [Branchiostoma lanceolatum]|uniref:tyrosine-protein kinase receptor torso-like n=1 Tax=Branchiostoma lanceolatum TaxID=7740 RepID=UPI00345159C0